MEGKMKRKKVLKGRAGRLVIRHSIAPFAADAPGSEGRLRADCTQPSAPRGRFRGRGIHLEAEPEE